MRSLDSTQNYLLGKTYKSAIWLFDITDKYDNSYHWSTREYTYNSTTYSFNIVDFPGITLNRNQSEAGIIAPNEVRIEIGNKDNAYTADNFIDGSVLIYLLIDDTLIAKWKFNIIRAYGSYQSITLECEDFLQKYLEGAYPNTQYVKALFPDNYYEDEDLCVPVCFGTAYIPLRPVEIDGDRYYLLGSTDNTYTIAEVHTPAEWGIKQSWSSSSYTFTQSTKTDQFGNSWRVFQPIIADSNLDGTPDACGVWISGQKILDMPTKFSYNTTTNPANIIKEILKDFGVPDDEIDDDSFTSAASTFTSWGLEWNGGFWKKSTRQSMLSTLLNMCHARILVRDKLVLSVLSKTSQKTITTSLVVKESFDYSKLSEELSDSGYVAWQKEDEPQDNMLKALVPGKGSTTDYISDETVFIPWVQNAVHVQKLACLVFQRKFFKVAQISFTGRSELLALEPGDVITINGDNYGGEYKVVIDSIEIGSDLLVKVTATRYSIELDDWDDLTQFSDITIYTTVPSAWENLPSGYGYGLRWDRDQATLFVAGTVRVTGGFIADAGGFIRSGQTAFDTGTGFFLGANDSGTPLFSVGSSSGKKITWNGTTLTIKGDLVFDSYNYWYPGGNFRVGSSSHYLYWDGSTFTVQGKLVAQSGSSIHGAYITDATITNVKISDISATKINAGYIVTTQLDTGSPPSTGCILDGNGLRAYKSGTMVVDISEDPYFRGEAHLGDDNDFVQIGEQNTLCQVRFYADGVLQGRVFSLAYNTGDIYVEANDNLILQAGTGGDVSIKANAEARLKISSDITIYRSVKPYSNITYDLGSSSYAWNNIYGKNVRTDELYDKGTGRIDFHCRIAPSSHITYDNGLSNYAWNNVYYCTANGVCSLGMVEEIADPLELLKNIKASKDKYTTKEIPKADYKTLPKFIKTIKYSDLKKDEEDFEEHLQSILSKNAEITYEDDKKVTVRIEALDVTATLSLLLGAIRQLSKKIEALEGH